MVRENTEGQYAGAGGIMRKGTPHEIAIQESVCTRMGVNAVSAMLLHMPGAAQTEITLCGKTNVLTYVFDLWERVFHEIGEKDYPDITRDYAHVDATVMWMVKNPEWFDVIVTENMFGDVITDLGAMIQGGMGIAAGGNINPEGVSMFEPIGGSAPKYTGLNVVNPLACIGAAAMMLDNLGETKAAERVENAIKTVCSTHLKSMAAGKMGYTTEEVGIWWLNICKSFLSKGSTVRGTVEPFLFLQNAAKSRHSFSLTRMINVPRYGGKIMHGRQIDAALPVLIRKIGLMKRL